MELVLRPDTDKIEQEEKKHYSKWENLVFKECPTCAAKSGSPTLCESCYHNRLVISKLRERKPRARRVKRRLET